MKKQLPSIEIMRIVKELQILIGGKFNKIYVTRQKEKKELFFEIHVPSKGKQMLRIILPNFILITRTKPEMPSTPDGYTSYLRKYLTSARIQSIEQIGAERIIKFTIDGRDRVKKEAITYFFYFELFSKGNAILTNDQNMILSPLEIQKWSERTIRAKETYTFPRLEYNIHKMKEDDFIKALEQSKKESVVTTLALDCGLGGLYAEEVCARAEIAKETQKPSKQEAKKVYAAWTILRKEIKDSPAYIIKEEEKIINIVPCKIKKYQEHSSKEMPSFLEALDLIVAPEVIRKEATQTESTGTKKVTKVETMIKSQQKQIVQCEETIQKNQKIAETIYENFQEVDVLLKELNKDRKILPWKDIKKKYKDHKVLKKINEKNQEILIEL